MLAPLIRKTEAILIIAIFLMHLIAAITTLNIAINDEQDSAVATQSAWDMFDSSGAGAKISKLSSSATPFAWEATADALVSVARETMPKFFGGALEDNASSYTAANAATLGNDQIRPLHVVANSLRFMQHRAMSPRMCDNDLLSNIGPSYFLLEASSAVSAACPGFSGGANSRRSPMRCCIRDFTSDELAHEAESNSFSSTNNASLTFRRAETESSVLFSGSGVDSALRAGSIYYPFTGFSLDTRYSADLKTVQLSSDGVPVAGVDTPLSSPVLGSIIKEFVDPLTRYVRVSLLTIFWSAAVCVHLHVHIELPASGAAVVSWRKASTVPLRPGLFGSPSPTIEGSTSEALFASGYNSGLVIAEVLAIFCSIGSIICMAVRYRKFFVRDKRVPLWANARLLLDVATALCMLVWFILRLVTGAQISQFADALKTANDYAGTPVSRATDFVSGSWTRFIDSLRGGSAVMAFFISVIFVVRFTGVVLQLVRRVVNARTLKGASEIAEDERTGAATAELLPAVLRRYFVDVFRLLTWAMAPLFVLCAMALQVLRGPNEFAWSYAGSALGTLVRERTLNLFGAFVVSKGKGASSYWENPSSGAYWSDLMVGTVIEVLVPLVFFTGLVFVAVRSQQEDVVAGRGKSAFFHHEDEEEARIIQMQLLPRQAPASAVLGGGGGAGGAVSPAASSPAVSPSNKDGDDEEEMQDKKDTPRLTEPLLKEHEKSATDAPPPRRAPGGAAAVPIPGEGGPSSAFGSTVELQNEAARRRLIVRIRELSERLRNRLGLVPPQRAEEDRQRKQREEEARAAAAAAAAKKRNVTFADAARLFPPSVFSPTAAGAGAGASPPSPGQSRGHVPFHAPAPARAAAAAAAGLSPTAAEDDDPYLAVPTSRDVAREAAIERLLEARRKAEAAGKSLSAEEELAALRGPLPANVADAIDRIQQLYEDLMTLLKAGRTIRDALVEDTKKTVDQIEEELAKAEEKKQREIDELNSQNKKAKREKKSSNKQEENVMELSDEDVFVPAVASESAADVKVADQQQQPPSDDAASSPPAYPQVPDAVKKQQHDDDDDDDDAELEAAVSAARGSSATAPSASESAAPAPAPAPDSAAAILALAATGLSEADAEHL